MKVSIAYKEAAAVNNVWSCYKDAEDALLKYKQVIFSKIRGGKNLPPEFEFKSLTEVSNQFDQDSKELKYATMLGLISAIEATFRIDHQIRLTGQKKDGISRQFIRLQQQKQKKKGEWTKFGDDILMTWKEIASKKEFIGAWEKRASIDKFKNIVILLNGILDMRDWIAHGRCWKRRSTQKYDPDTIHSVAEELMHNLPHNNFYGRKYLST